MSKVEKITPEELVELQKFVGNLNQVQMELGKLELQKSQAISAYAEVQTSMQCITPWVRRSMAGIASTT